MEYGLRTIDLIMDLLQLKIRWNDLSSRINKGIFFQSSYWQNIVSSYSESGRYYHTLSHIDACLFEFDQIKNKLDDPDAIELAIWFHDIVYNPLSKTNEEESAQLVFDFSMNCFNVRIANVVSNLVLLTKNHSGLTLSEDAKYFLDIDLSILGQHPEIFKKYDDDIRKEYIQVPDEIYYPARKKIMQEFSTRPRIFLTDLFHEKYDKQARENLKQYE